jgi:hypothetical protein
VFGHNSTGFSSELVLCLEVICTIEKENQAVNDMAAGEINLTSGAEPSGAWGS